MRARRIAAAVAAAAALLAPAGAEAAFGPLGERQRISFMGPNGSNDYDAEQPSVAHNPTADEYLVVWRGEDNTPPLVNGELEIYAQRLSGRGAPLGERVRVSAQGADGDPTVETYLPSVAYNPIANEYLIAWTGEIGNGNGFEIWGRRLSAAGARLGGSDDLRISDMGPGASYNARTPSVVANAASGQYLVVWWGDDDTGTLVDNEYEIFGQRLTATGAPVGADDFRISEQGADGNPQSGAFIPSVAYNPAAGEYLVAWQGEIGTSEGYEIFGQRLTAAGAEAGGSDFQVSDLGPDNSYSAYTPSVASNPTSGEYLVVFTGDDNIPPLADDEAKIFGQRLTATGAPTGADDFRISTQGSDGDPISTAFAPRVAYNPSVGEYVVAWRGEIGTTSDYEIWAQRLTAAGAEVGGGDFRVSDMGRDGDENYAAAEPGVAANSTVDEYLVVWWSPDDTPPLIEGDNEIFGRRLGVSAPTLIGTDPAGPADSNSPRVKAAVGSVDPSSTIDVFTSADCTGTPAVDGAPAGDLIGSGITVPVADNTTTALSASAHSDGATSRCSNAVSYTEQTPPAGGGDRAGAFGARTLVTLTLARKRIPARGPLKIGAANGNAFTVTGRLSAQTTEPVPAARKRRIKLTARAFAVGAHARKTVSLRLPRTVRSALRRKGKVSLRLTATVMDRRGTTRTVRTTVTPRLRTARR